MVQAALKAYMDKPNNTTKGDVGELVLERAQQRERVEREQRERAEEEQRQREQQPQQRERELQEKPEKLCIEERKLRAEETVVERPPTP